MSLKNQTISGVKWTTLSTVIITVLSLVQVSIVTRFLNPSDFGLMALVMVVVGFSQNFLDMGISNAIIHKQSTTREQLSTLYWVNIFAGIILCVIINMIAPVVADIYQEPKLSKLISMVSITFVIQPFGQQFMVLWQKEMRFKELALAQIISKIFGVTTVIYFSIKGYGVMALVYGNIVGSISMAVQLIFRGYKEYRPLFIFKPRDIREYMSFGAYQMGEKTINYFNSQMDTILIGKLLGMESLGIYNIAKMIVIKPSMIINPIVTRVTFPAMAKIQNESKRLKLIYLKTINYLSSVTFPIYCFIFIFSTEIVSVMFGEKWIEAIPIMQILALWAALRGTGNPVGSLLLAKGKASWGFWWNFGMLFYFPFGIFAGSNWGLSGVSYSLLFMVFPVGIIANWYFLVRPLANIAFYEYHKEILRPLMISIISGIIVIISIMLIDEIFTRLLIGIILGTLSVILLNLKYNNTFLHEIKGILIKK